MRRPKGVFLVHPVRGVFVDGVYDGYEYKPKFRWSIKITDGFDFVWEGDARNEMAKWPEKLRLQTEIRVL